MKNLFLVSLSILLISCSNQSNNEISQETDVWHKNATIYEVNVRQFTPEGTFNAFLPHIDRIHNMGIDILWIMPIHPIGKVNRKGYLGSYYSVKDYFDINPEFGTLNEFKSLVKEIHKMDMFIILDWVANHTAWDNQLTEKHPDWYTKNSQGVFQPPSGTDWSDVVDLNYNRIDLHDSGVEPTEYLNFTIPAADVVASSLSPRVTKLLPL